MLSKFTAHFLFLSLQYVPNTANACNWILSTAQYTMCNVMCTNIKHFSVQCLQLSVNTLNTANR